MTEIRLSVRPAWLDTLLFTGLAAILFAAAAQVMFGVFMYYDDEGYVLISLRNFIEHGGLYRDIFTQYGPFPFVFYWASNLCGLPITHAAGRCLTLIFWALTALSCAWYAGRLTRSLLARLGTLAATFAYLWQSASEPSHPGGLIMILTALAGVLGGYWIEQGYFRRWSLLVGGVIAALLLTKINVGAFVAFAAFSWLILQQKNSIIRNWGSALVFIGCAALPLSLMRALLTEPATQTFAMVWACSALAVTASIFSKVDHRIGWASIVWIVVGIAVIGSAVLTVTIAKGSDINDIIDGVLLGPLRNAIKYSNPVNWAQGIKLISLTSVGLCFGALLLSKKYRALVDTGVAILRVICALSMGFALTLQPLYEANFLVFGFTLPCLWVFVWPLADTEPPQTSAQAWLGLLLLGQCLHAYPVAGSQLAWGSVLALPLGIIGGWEAATWLHRRATPHAPKRTIQFAVGVLLIAVMAATTGASWNLVQYGARKSEGHMLNLPGTGPLKMPQESASLLSVLTLNAAAHTDVLFSEPGMSSFNLWSDVPTPTRANVTHWFSLLSKSQQEAIILELKSHPRAGVIIDRGHIAFLAAQGLAPTGLLHDFIEQNFEPAFRLNYKFQNSYRFHSFDFLVHKGRKISPFLLGTLLERNANQPAIGAETERFLLQFSLLLPIGKSVASAAVESGQNSLILDAHNARVELTRLNARGDPISKTQTASWPLEIKGPTLVSIYFNASESPKLTFQSSIILRDADGTELALARFAP